MFISIIQMKLKSAERLRIKVDKKELQFCACFTFLCNWIGKNNEILDFIYSFCYISKLYTNALFEREYRSRSYRWQSNVIFVVKDRWSATMWVTPTTKAKDAGCRILKRCASRLTLAQNTRMSVQSVCEPEKLSKRSNPCLPAGIFLCPLQCSINLFPFQINLFSFISNSYKSPRPRRCAERPK